ncbi:MAG: tetratricopeptide repeat protein [Chitinivibrionales bacterium]|nr:tetratricopeptide repeat protein [Chitinivibrionales bacterium]
MNSAKSCRCRGNRKRVIFLVLCFLPFTVFKLYSYEGSGGYDAPYFQADFYQDLGDYSSALVNPALLYRVNQVHFDAGFYRWSLGHWGYQQLALQIPIRRNQTAGFTIINAGTSIDPKKIDPDSWNIVDDPDAGTRFSDSWIVGNYGVRLLPWLMLGGNVKFRLQNQFGETSVSNYPGLDFGVYLNPLDHYRFGDLGFSLNFQDILPSQVEWKSGGDIIKSKVTTRLRAGIRYSVFNDKLVGNVETVIDNAFSDIWQGLIDSAEFFDIDTATNSYDVDKKSLNALKKQLRLSGHLKWQFIPQLWLKAGWNNNNIPYVGLNANLMFPLPEMINYMAVDMHFGYGFIEEILLDKDERGFTFMSKFVFDVGPTREQRESKRLYDKLILAPMNAYNEAMRLYVAGKYWLASYAFGKVITLFPNFHLNDKASFYMGNCYRFLYMHDIAREVYEDALEQYTTSEMRAKYLYGLMHIDYREEKYDDALKQHAFIVNLYPESDIRSDADYLAGEVHFARKNYHAAEELFAKLQPGDPSYLYAQYTLAIINIENKKTQAAIGNLRSVVEDTSLESGKLLLIDAANTKLGHLYFEDVELRKAVESYKRVSEGSPYADEALIGMAWSWIKVNQPGPCAQTLNHLISRYPESPLIPEAYLLRGYAGMLQKRYSAARSDLEKCMELCSEDYITESDLDRRKTKFDNTVESFRPTGEEIKKNALRRPTNQTLEERTELKAEYDEFARANEDFFEYTLLAKSHKKFLRRKDQILMDAEYALAKVISLMGTDDRAIKKEREKAQELDEEIQKLQEELQDIE